MLSPSVSVKSTILPGAVKDSDNMEPQLRRSDGDGVALTPHSPRVRFSAEPVLHPVILCFSCVIEGFLQVLRFSSHLNMKLGCISTRWSYCPVRNQNYQGVHKHLCFYYTLSNWIPFQANRILWRVAGLSSSLKIPDFAVPLPSQLSSFSQLSFMFI